MIFTFDHDYYLINVRYAICFFQYLSLEDVHVCLMAYDFIMNFSLQAIQCDTLRHRQVHWFQVCTCRRRQHVFLEHGTYYMGLITAYWSKIWLGYVMNVDAEY